MTRNYSTTTMHFCPVGDTNPASWEGGYLRTLCGKISWEDCVLTPKEYVEDNWIECKSQICRDCLNSADFGFWFLGEL